MPDVWTLHQEPHRHYKLNGSWTVKGVGRIAGVTSVLDGADALTAWSAAQAIAASENVARDWFGAGPALARSVLSFGELAALQPEYPDNVRDAKGDSGTAAHSYLHDMLTGGEWDCAVGAHLPYGLRCAIDDFIAQHRPVVVRDAHGPRVERVVGDVERAVAGTYDAGVFCAGWGGIEVGVHRLDLKQSNTVQPKHFAQIASYERCATMCGEEPSDFLTILHITPTGTFKPHSIAVGSDEHRLALGLFDAHLIIHRSTPVLAKVLR